MCRSHEIKMRMRSITYFRRIKNENEMENFWGVPHISFSFMILVNTIGENKIGVKPFYSQLISIFKKIYSLYYALFPLYFNMSDDAKFWQKKCI